MDFCFKALILLDVLGKNFKGLKEIGLIEFQCQCKLRLLSREI